MNYDIELERNNVTPAQFFSMIRFECKKKGIEFYLDLDQFAQPDSEYSSSYTVIDGKKHCHSSYYQTFTNMKRKHASYQTPEGFTRHYYTDEFEEYQETKRVYNDRITDAADAACKAEKITQFAYDYQTYVLNFDGSMYNEICEFTFDNNKKGHGYYYQVNKD